MKTFFLIAVTFLVAGCFEKSEPEPDLNDLVQKEIELHEKRKSDWGYMEPSETPGFFERN